MLGFDVSEPLVWILIAVIFATIEALTLGLTTIWFSVGALAASLIALIGGPIPLQLAVFLAVSIILLYFTRPLAEKRLKVGHEKNSLEQIIGQTALVTKDILPHSTGQAKLNGQIWTAVSADHQVMEKGKEVTVVRIEGVKLVVSPKKGEE